MYIKCSSDFDEAGSDVFDGNELTRAYYAANSDSGELLEIYAYDPETLVRRSVAHNLHTPPEVLDILSSDSQYSVRREALLNPFIPVNTLVGRVESGDLSEAGDLMSSSRVPEDRIAAYYRRAVDYQRSDNWTDDDCEWYDDAMHNIASNPNTPERILYTLSAWDDDYVNDGLIRNPNTPDDILDHIVTNNSSYTEDLLEYIAEHPNASADTLRDIIDNYALSRRVYHYIANNPNVTAEVFDGIDLRDTHYDVLADLAENPNITQNLINRLFDEEDGILDEGLVKNPSTPASILLGLIKRYGEDDSISRAAIMHPNYPKDRT